MDTSNDQRIRFWDWRYHKAYFALQAEEFTKKRNSVVSFLINKNLDL